MSARLFRVLYTDDRVAPQRRYRAWLGCGQPLAIHGVLVTPCWDDYENTHLAHWMVRGADGPLEVMPLAPLTIAALHDYCLVPRAVSEDLTGRVTAVLVEIQHSGDGRPVWENNPLERRTA